MTRTILRKFYRAVRNPRLAWARLRDTARRLALGSPPAVVAGDGEPSSPDPTTGLLGDLARNWDGLARTDPLWAILSHPDKQGGRWQIEEFFAIGRKDVNQMIAQAAAAGAAMRSGRALDFGCGVGGRLTQALGEHFDRVVGIDISPRMIEIAAQLNRCPQKVSYLVSGSLTLPFRDNPFDFVCTQLVLQHMTPQLALGYVAEFLRVLRPGGIALFDVLLESSAMGAQVSALTPVETQQGTFVVGMHLMTPAEVLKVITASGGETLGTRPQVQSGGQVAGSVLLCQEEVVKPADRVRALALRLAGVAGAIGPRGVRTSRTHW